MAKLKRFTEAIGNGDKVSHIRQPGKVGVVKYVIVAGSWASQLNVEWEDGTFGRYPPLELSIIGRVDVPTPEQLKERWNRSGAKMSMLIFAGYQNFAKSTLHADWDHLPEATKVKLRRAYSHG